MSDDDFYDISPISNFVDSEIPSNKEPKYDWIMSKFCSSNLEYWELQIIKDQYLDMDVEYDKYFYDYLLDKMYESGKTDII